MVLLAQKTHKEIPIMPDISKLKELLKKQNALADEIAQQTAEYAGDKLISELQSLKSENDALKASCTENEKERKILSEENHALKETLKSQLYVERSRFLRDSAARMAAFFGGDTAMGKNVLSVFEKNTQQRFSELRRALDKESSEIQEKFDRRLSALEADAAVEIDALRKSYSGLSEDATVEYKRQTSFLGEKEIDGQTTERVIKESEHKVERMIGLGVLGKIGAVIIIIGMIALSQLAYTFFSDVYKCVFMFAVASLILGFALLLNRKKEKRTPFTITILSLGVALEYTALSISYFTLTILSVWTALGICVVITAITYVIALRLKNEVVTIFAQIGGYLPVIAIFGDINLIYGSMVYFLILNVLGFLLSVKYKWPVLNFVAFGLNIAAVIFVSVSIAVMYQGRPFGLETGLTLGFMFLSFALHTVLPLLTNIRVKTRFTRADLILMGLATSCNLVLFYTMFAQYGIRDYSGWLSILFAAFYFGIYFFARKFFKADSSTRTLFWLTGIVLLGLFTPMHFADRTWLTFGWILESAVLIIYAILRSKKFMFWTGVWIAAAALFSFLVFDITLKANNVGAADIFIYKYLMLTLASVAVLGAAVHKGMPVLGYSHIQSGKRIFIQQNISPAQAYAAAVYTNAAGFTIYAVWKIFDSAAHEQIQIIGNLQYLMFALMILTLFVFALFVPKLFKAFLVHRVSLAISAAALLFLLVVNSLQLPAFEAGGDAGGKVAAAFLTVLTTLASGYAFYDLFTNIADLVDTKNLRAGLVVALASYFLFWFTHLCLVQYRMKFTNLSFGIVYMAVSLVCLLLGLYFKSALTRRFALCVAGAAIFKLFIIDTFGLELAYRVICYFVFGAILIGMSFLYQYYYKKFAKTEESTAIAAQPEENIQPPVTGDSAGICETTEPAEE